MAFDYDYAGNLSLLDRPTVAFFASRVVPPELYGRALKWAEACCATDRVVISGFHSPLEKAVFQLLLEARHPVIWALGRSLYRRYSPEVEAAFAEGRMLVFAVRNGPRTGFRTAQTRNLVVASLSDESVYAIAGTGDGSSLAVVCGLEPTTKRVTLLS